MLFVDAIIIDQDISMQGGPSDADLKAVSNKFLEVLKGLEAHKEWEKVDDKPVLVLRMERDDRVIVRAEVTINLPFEPLVDYFNDAAFMKKITDRIKQFDVIYKHPEFVVFHSHMQGVAMVSDRELVAVFTHHREGNKLYFGNRSCDYPCAPYKDTVRAFAHCGGYILEKTGENTTRVVNIVDMDPNGSIPGFVKNKMGTMRAAVLAELEQKIRATLK